MSKYLMFENKIVEADGKPVLIDINDKTITANGEYRPASEGLTGYGTITVDVQPNLGEKEVNTNQVLIAKDEGLDGYSKVIVNVREGEPYKLTDKTITAEDMLSGNIFNAGNDNADGYLNVTVDLPIIDKTIDDISGGNEFFAADDGAYGYKSVTIDVKTGASDEDLVGYNQALNMLIADQDAREGLISGYGGFNTPEDYRFHTGENVILHGNIISKFMNENNTAKTFKHEPFYNGKNTPISLWECLIRYSDLDFNDGSYSGYGSYGSYGNHSNNNDIYNNPYIQYQLPYPLYFRELDINSLILGDVATARFDISNPTGVYGFGFYLGLSTFIGEFSIANCENLESIEVECLQASEGLTGPSTASMSHNYKLKKVDLKPCTVRGSYYSTLTNDWQTTSLNSAYLESFFDCDISLEELNVYGSCIFLSEHLFHNCYSLKNLTCGLLINDLAIGNRVDGACFNNCGLEHLVCDNIYTDTHGDYYYGTNGNFFKIPNLKSIVLRSPIYSTGSEPNTCLSNEFDAMPQNITMYIPNIIYYDESNTSTVINCVDTYTQLFGSKENITVKPDTELYHNDGYLLIASLTSAPEGMSTFTASRACPAMKQTDGHPTTWRDWINSGFNLDKIGIYDGYTGDFTFNAKTVELTFKIPEAGCVCRCATSGLIQPLIHTDVLGEILSKIANASANNFPTTEINNLLQKIFISPDDPLPVFDVGCRIPLKEMLLFNSVDGSTSELTDLEKKLCINVSPYTSFFAPTKSTKYRDEQKKLQKKPLEIIYNKKADPTEEDITMFALKQYYGEDYEVKNDINSMTMTYYNEGMQEALLTDAVLIGSYSYGSPKNPYIAADIMHHVRIPSEPPESRANCYIKVTYDDFYEVTMPLEENPEVAGGAWRFNKYTNQCVTTTQGAGSLDYPFADTFCSSFNFQGDTSCFNFYTMIIDNNGIIRRDYKDYSIEVHKLDSANQEKLQQNMEALSSRIESGTDSEFTYNEMFDGVLTENNKIYEFHSPKYAQPGVVNLKYFFDGVDNVQIKVGETGQIWKRYNSKKSDMINAFEEGWIAGWRPVE